MTDLPEAVPDAIRHYLERTTGLLARVTDAPGPEALLSIRLAPDIFDTRTQFAVAIGFAARALCPPSGRPLPEMPDDPVAERLLAWAAEVAALIEPVTAAELTRPVTHIAGEATLTQDPADYVLRFALPNMIFHLSLAYAGLRHGGLDVGKADFDGLHAYPRG